MTGDSHDLQLESGPTVGSCEAPQRRLLRQACDTRRLSHSSNRCLGLEAWPSARPLGLRAGAIDDSVPSARRVHSCRRLGRISAS
jgi:hypothetical protein